MYFFLKELQHVRRSKEREEFKVEKYVSDCKRFLEERGHEKLRTSAKYRRFVAKFNTAQKGPFL